MIFCLIDNGDGSFLQRLLVPPQRGDRPDTRGPGKRTPGWSTRIRTRMDIEARAGRGFERGKMLPDMGEEAPEFARGADAVEHQPILRIRFVGLLCRVCRGDNRACIVDDAEFGVAVLRAAQPDPCMRQSLQMVFVPPGALLLPGNIGVDVGLQLEYLRPEVFAQSREYIYTALQSLGRIAERSNDLLIGEQEAAEEHLMFRPGNLIDQCVANMRCVRQVVGGYMNDIRSPRAMNAMVAVWRSGNRHEYNAGQLLLAQVQRLLNAPNPVFDTRLRQLVCHDFSHCATSVVS